jgi:hypothetical protein
MDKDGNVKRKMKAVVFMFIFVCFRIEYNSPKTEEQRELETRKHFY